ncbi:cytochrome P450 [Aspergillus ellipticus CBS 707.79]|uniref:Cytochrome P450 n=1 Tax=Aspergillus ellipticus CBS 707.79 TaxID=1448320 RepID=A0A319DUJ2_9EURO|nr:cytochrome P450 [Aspergillus ellipticus CBS 707.79]
MIPVSAGWLMAAILLAVLILRCVWVAVYRLFLHPLANIPGPLLARVTHLYAFWYNMQGGLFYLQVQQLHGHYGPVVRITPEEIHLSDPENCEKIYFIGSRYGKDPSFYGAFGTKKATFTTPSPDIHRVKRTVLNPFFSRKKVLELEEIVQEKANKLVERMQEAFGSTGSIDLHYGFRAVSVDVITDYAFDNSYGFLDEQDFGVAFFDMIRGFGPAFWFFQQLPAVQDLALKMPFWLSKLTSSALTRMMLHHNGSRRQIAQVKNAVDRGEKGTRATIFHKLLHPQAAEGHVVPTVEELKDEAYIMVAAAADTTGNALTIAAYNIVQNPGIYERLTEELKQAFPDPDGRMDFVVLEKLPYLTAIIKESLRLSCGVPGRLPRVVPDPGAEFNGYQVPTGTVVSMSSWILHHNESIFPCSERFDPSRWINSAQNKTLERYLFSFSKGSRQCIGMPLAYCELYVTLGRVFRRYNDLKTPRKSGKELMYNDYFSSYHTKGNNKFVFERGS